MAPAFDFAPLKFSFVRNGSTAPPSETSLRVIGLFYPFSLRFDRAALPAGKALFNSAKNSAVALQLQSIVGKK
jgi:hypothetical protein